MLDYLSAAVVQKLVMKLFEDGKGDMNVAVFWNFETHQQSEDIEVGS
jgi:hypothetical protein